MTSKKITEFKHNGDTIKVFTGDGTSSVFYSKNNGSSKSSGLKYNSDKGNFTSGSGKSVDFEDAEPIIRNLLS